MKFHFDSNQEYQIEAIRAATDIFEGQPLGGGDFEFCLTATSILLSKIPGTPYSIIDSVLKDG